MGVALSQINSYALFEKNDTDWQTYDFMEGYVSIHDNNLDVDAQMLYN